MKKSIIVIACAVSLFLLCGCTPKEYTPVVNTEFNLNAVYKTGDFSYACKIKSQQGKVSVTALSSGAEGMVITYDGKNARFAYNDMEKTISSAVTPLTNPARIIYDVLKIFENGETNVKKIGDNYNYTGKTQLCSFVLLQSVSDEKFVSLSFPEYNISIEFA